MIVRSHLRAEFWLEKTDPADFNVKAVIDVLKNLPLLIRQSGLALAVCTLEAQAKKDEGARWVLPVLRNWFEESWKATIPHETSLYRAIKHRAGSISNLLADTHETMMWIEWGRRILEAKLPSEPAPEPPVQNEH